MGDLLTRELTLIQFLFGQQLVVLESVDILFGSGLQFETIQLIMEVFFCFAQHSVRVSDRFMFTLASFSTIIFLILSTTLILITITNFVRILLELHELKKLRLRFENQSNQTNNVVRINGRDKPLYCTGEERTAKSLTLVCFIQFICTSVS